MCGIVGTLSFEGSGFAVTPPYLVRMRDTMVHRGPDGDGLWVSDDGSVGFGFRRLKIIDLSDQANQPMSNEDGSLRLVYNGEIYNHAEIRRELEELGGHTWKTDHSDTEVILHAFEEWGTDCLHRFRGMFAFALWNADARELWLVRDRIGVKPLYYSVHHGRIVFASEIKALLEDPDQERRIDEEAFYHYLSFLTTPAPQTLFEGIRKLEPASWLRVGSDGTIRSARYWDVWDHTVPLVDASEEEIADRLLSELRTSVKLRKVSDVPVGVFLSGGIDSSTNAALFSEGESAPIKTFSIGYEGGQKSYRNEFEYARTMAGLVGADHHEQQLGLDDLVDFLPRMIRLQDEPIADPVCFPVYYVSKLARENGVIVCQVGEGADELFWGYPSWKTHLRLQRYDDLPVADSLKRAGLRLLRLVGTERRREWELLRRGAMGLPIIWSGVRKRSPRRRSAGSFPRD
jgi:asparagine synthase (glutamine-hydrolysing)